MVCFGGKVCACTWSAEWEVTLSRDAKVDALITPFTKGEMVAPGAYHDTLPKVP